MAKKRASKPAAKPAAKPAKKTAARQVTIKEIEDSSLFADQSDLNEASPEESNEKRDVEKTVSEPSNGVNLAEPEAEDGKIVEDRVLIPPKEPEEDLASLPVKDNSEEQEIRENSPQVELTASSIPLPEKDEESSGDDVHRSEQIQEHVESSLSEPSSTGEKPVESPVPDSLAVEKSDGERPSPQPENIEIGPRPKEETGTGGGLELDDESLFESKADLEEIFSAMEDVKKDEAKAIASAVAAIESGQDAASALKDLSSDVADKIQKQLDERSLEEEQVFVTEDDFIQHARNSLSKTWYHCIYFLAFNSESGTATKKVLYDALKDVLSKSPVDSVPEHMFNFGLSALVKVMLYDKPIVSFKRGGEFSLETNRKKLQELLLAAGMPMSRRPVVTKKMEKKMISDFFENEKLF
ncbi:MAG TPA: hypothetical protein VKM55_14660 [Candidatus Lokiarchaeia archaeon]|nr:hypothetical protein [Candidatus Lokiarchaeia archaeon]